MLIRNWGYFSFSETGTIGDTIGGITAPISGLLGAYLVFLALKAQVAANQEIQVQIEQQKIQDDINRSKVFLRDIIEQTSRIIQSMEIPINRGFDSSTIKGIDALIRFVKEYSTIESSVYFLKKSTFLYAEMSKGVFLFNYFYEKLVEADLDKKDIEYYLFIFEFEYFGYIIKSVELMRNSMMRGNKCGEEHYELINKFMDIRKLITNYREEVGSG